MKNKLIAGRRTLAMLIAILTFCLGASPLSASAATNNFNLDMNLIATSPSIDILNENGQPTTLGDFVFGNRAFSFQCQAWTANLGLATETNAHRVYLTIPPTTTPNGWTLTLSPTNGTNSEWTGQNGHAMAYNKPVDNCADVYDPAVAKGVLKASPQYELLHSECTNCSTEGITTGNYTRAFSDTQTSVTMASGAPNGGQGWRGWIENMRIEQTVPASQPVDTYTLPMTLTLTAL